MVFSDNSVRRATARGCFYLLPVQFGCLLSQTCSWLTGAELSLIFCCSLFVMFCILRCSSSLHWYWVFYCVKIMWKVFILIPSMSLSSSISNAVRCFTLRSLASTDLQQPESFSLWLFFILIFGTFNITLHPQRCTVALMEQIITVCMKLDAG